MKIKLRGCKIVEEKHKKNLRSYLHVGHYKGNVICYAKEFFELPFNHRMALLAHEVGHILGAKDEDQADTLAEEYFGIKMYYQDTVTWGKDLEWVTEKDAIKVKRILELKF